MLYEFFVLGIPKALIVCFFIFCKSFYPNRWWCLKANTAMYKSTFATVPSPSSLLFFFFFSKSFADLIITHLFGQRKQKVIPEEIFFVIYCPIIPCRQVWMDGILFYVLRSLYLKNNNTKSNRVKPILYVEIWGVLWYRIKIVKKKTNIRK